MSTLRSCARLRFVATLVTLLVALGSPRAASAREGAIRFWAMGASPDDARMFARLGETFRQRTGVAVDVTPLGWGDETKYLAAMAAELPPDIGITNLGGPMNYGSVGGLVDLQREFPAETEALKARFYPSILPAFSFRGHLYGVPTEVTTLVVFYRADVFRRLGIAPPTTWSELDAAIRAVESRGMRFYFGWTRGAAWSLPYAFTLPFGYPGLHVDAGPPAVARVDWTEPGYQRAVLQALRL